MKVFIEKTNSQHSSFSRKAIFFHLYKNQPLNNTKIVKDHRFVIRNVSIDRGKVTPCRLSRISAQPLSRTETGVAWLQSHPRQRSPSIPFVPRENTCAKVMEVRVRRTCVRVFNVLNICRWHPSSPRCVCPPRGSIPVFWFVEILLFLHIRYVEDVDCR